MSKNIVVTEDNFVWKVLTPKEAREMMDNIEIFSVEECKVIHVDSLLESHPELEDAMDKGLNICLEVGYVDMDVTDYIKRHHRMKRQFGVQ
jgi:hypothetical protein